MSATPATVEAYLTAAQTAFAAGNYAEARNQIVLGQMELAKLPGMDGNDGSQTQFRAGSEFDRLLNAIDRIDQKTSRGTRRSVLRGI